MLKGNLMPAYGRVYATKDQAIKNWEGGKNFIFLNPSSRWNGKCCSIRDFGPDDQLQVRFGHGCRFTAMVRGR